MDNFLKNTFKNSFLSKNRRVWSKKINVHFIHPYLCRIKVKVKRI